MKNLKTEFQKLRRRYIWFFFAADLGITILWIIYTIYDLNLERINETTGMLGTNLLLINTILTPLVLAVVASRMCDIEQTGNTYTWIFTMQSPESFLNSKLAAGGIYLLFFDLLQTAFYTVLNQSYIPGWSVHYLEFFVTVFTVHFFLFLLQLLLSLRFENQLLPLFVSIGGTFAGLFSWFLHQIPLRYMIPWGYFAALCNIGMNYDEATRYSYYYFDSYPIIWLIILFFATGLCYFFGKRSFIRQITKM